MGEKRRENLLKMERDKLKLKHTCRGRELMNHLLHLNVD